MLIILVMLINIIKFKVVEVEQMIYFLYHLVFHIILEKFMDMNNLPQLKRKKDCLIVDLEKKKLKKDHHLIY